MKPKITMRELGSYGRWGNQLLQYAFVRMYAAQNNLDYEVPLWAGQSIFGLTDPKITTHLERQRERNLNGYLSHPCIPYPGEFFNRDFLGYGQLHTSWFRQFEPQIRQMYTPTAEYTNRAALGLEHLKRRGATLIGLQIRRSDFGHSIHYRTPVSWYREWLARHWSRFKNPVLFIESEERDIYRWFPEYPVFMSEHLGINITQNNIPGYTVRQKRWDTPVLNDFFPRWWLLVNCNVLLISNSTFGFTAAMLAKNLKEAWRSNLPARTFLPFDPWWSDPGEYNHLDDWPGIPGTQCDSNPFEPHAHNKHKAVEEKQP